MMPKAFIPGPCQQVGVVQTAKESKGGTPGYAAAPLDEVGHPKPQPLGQRGNNPHQAATMMNQSCHYTAHITPSLKVPPWFAYAPCMSGVIG